MSDFFLGFIKSVGEVWSISHYQKVRGLEKSWNKYVKNILILLGIVVLLLFVSIVILGAKGEIIAKETQFVRKGTLPDGRRVGELESGEIILINE
jgi:hypothetical protein